MTKDEQDKVREFRNAVALGDDARRKIAQAHATADCARG